jgi:hypothetical protein
MGLTLLKNNIPGDKYLPGDKVLDLIVPTSTRVA